MAKAKVFAHSNPTLERSGVAGVEAGHSSLVPPTEHTQVPGHEQQDDDLLDIGPPQDPNISGRTPTEGTYTWLAGKLSAWQENDDYRQFFERGDREVAESATTHRYRTIHDGDYDDNGQVPTGIGHERGDFSSVPSVGEEGQSDTGFPLGPVIVRRL